MSVTESPIPEKSSDLINIPVPMFSLNEVLRESLRVAQNNPNLIVRCEPMPYIRGKQQDMLRLFDLLIGMILDQWSPEARLFLYVDCDMGHMENSSDQGFRKFVVKFYTNISTGESWKNLNSNMLSECERIISDHQGAFQVNNIQNTGCLFAISLSGKFA